MRLAIVGGGISGLALAYYVASRQKSAPVFDQISLFEGSGRLGGVIETRRWHDLVVEMGPDSLVDKPGGAIDLLREIGLDDHLIPMNPSAKPALMRTREGWKPFPSTETRSYSLDLGVHLMIERLEERLEGIDLAWDRPISRIEPDDKGWRLEGEETYEALALAVPASQVERLLGDSGIDISWCREIVYHPRAVVGAVYPPGSFQDAALGEHTGFVVAPDVGLGLTAVTWLSQKWPYRHRTSHIVLRTFWGPPGENPAAWTDDELLARHRRALEALAGLRSEPLWWTMQRLESALPRVPEGFQVQPLASTERYLTFLGPYAKGPGVSDCVRHAAEEANRLLAWARHRP
ncbi:MAG: FAD-dependent oxidoreductase [Firmicutes bacterium]|nr:FAD-dependent oxidoreductase [Bacillota bacterium]